MKILISCIPFDQGKSGISVYTAKIVEELSRLGHELVLFTEHDAADSFRGFNVIPLPKWTGKPLISMLYHLFILPLKVKRQQCDFCIIAGGNRRAFSYMPTFTITVVHDLAQYHVAEKYDPLRMFYLKKVLPTFVRRTSAVVAISRSTALDLERFWKVAPEKIHINFNGLTIPSGQHPGWLNRFNLQPGRYILYLSRIQHPGKNHVNLIKAFEMLPEQLKNEYYLVLGGADWDGATEVHRYAKNSDCAERIIFTDFIDSTNLKEAYRNAAVYVFPSLFEGFGLSLIEAMHYEVPCCCSDNSSLGEIGRDAALLFNPESPDEIAAALKRILSENELRQQLIAAGKLRAAEFSWREHAVKLLQIYENSHRS
ncbi:MAG: glycosyltransferase family 1 protein [Victivallaceae bacterium]|nr:glycosyltransferase family 1 protein [Victivallaceae bacterium]